MPLAEQGLGFIKRPAERSGLDVDGQAVVLGGGQGVAESAAWLCGRVLFGLVIRLVPPPVIRAARFTHGVLLLRTTIAEQHAPQKWLSSILVDKR